MQSNISLLIRFLQLFFQQKSYREPQMLLFTKFILAQGHKNEAQWGSKTAVTINQIISLTTPSHYGNQKSIIACCMCSRNKRPPSTPLKKIKTQCKEFTHALQLKYPKRIMATSQVKIFKVNKFTQDFKTPYNTKPNYWRSFVS